MTDNQAQPNATSYVDTYTPPTSTPAASTTLPPAAPQAEPADSPSMPPTSPSLPPMPSSNSPFSRPPGMGTPSVSAPSTPSQPAAPEATSPVSQALEDQNIFHLLGVTDATEEEKEAFLDELQQVIWEDFLENDVELLITEEEMVELRKIMATKEKSELEQQEAIVVYLEKLIPDLEEIMLEKALELKADMVKERIKGMKEYYAGQPEKLDQLTKAESMIAEDQWRAAAEFLNKMV